jgi:hypothetical protein
MLKRRSNFQEGGVVQRAYEEYQQRVGQPFQQTIRGGVRGYFGLPLMSDANEIGKEAYRQAEAIGSMPGVGVPAKIARGASEVAQTAPALAVGAFGLVKRIKKETPISFKADESLLATAQKDVEKAGEKYLFIDDMQRDSQGVIPKKLKNLDTGLTKGDYTEQQIKKAFSDTRKALKDKYGDKLVLYRADAPKEERLADAKTVYMGDESLAKRFEQQGRKAKPYIVDVDDVLGVYTTRSGYYEVIVKKEALEKTIKAKEPQMAKGGMMARNIPGFQEGGANVDPISGNEVPTGSMPEEVRDDIDAKLSPGEFVLPADVVRFIGLERLMKMRDEAKKGLQRMSDIGQMGNADEVGEASNGTYEDAGFESEIDDILSEIEAEENGRDVNEQTEVMMAEGGVAVGTKTNQTTTAGRPVYRTAEGDNVSELSITVPFKGFWANVPSIHNGVKYDEDQIVEMLDKGKIKPTSVHESIKEAVDAAKARSAGLLDKPEMAQGGFMKSGTDLTKAPKNPVFDVRYYKNAEGSVMYITHINGKPMTPIPEGYKAVTQEEAQKVGQKAEEAAKAVQTTNESGGYDATQLDKSVADFLDEEARQQAEFDAQDKSKEGPREQRMGKVSNVMETIAKWATPYGTVRNVMDFLKGPQRTDEEAANISIESRTGTSIAGIEAESKVIDLGLNDFYAKAAAANATESYQRGTDRETAVANAVANAEQAKAVQDAAEESYKHGGQGGESSVGTPESTPGTPSNPGSGGIDDNFGMARGGLVNKRQYPTKKKRGKGIASAKS